MKITALIFFALITLGSPSAIASDDCNQRLGKKVRIFSNLLPTAQEEIMEFTALFTYPVTLNDIRRVQGGKLIPVVLDLPWPHNIKHPNDPNTFVAFALLEENLTHKKMKIRNFGVHPAYRYYGIGTALIEKIIALVRNRGFSSLEIKIPSDKTLSTFLRKRGFTVDSIDFSPSDKKGDANMTLNYAISEFEAAPSFNPLHAWENQLAAEEHDAMDSLFNPHYDDEAIDRLFNPEYYGDNPFYDTDDED